MQEGMNEIVGFVKHDPVPVLGCFFLALRAYCSFVFIASCRRSETNPMRLKFPVTLRGPFRKQS